MLLTTSLIAVRRQAAGGETQLSGALVALMLREGASTAAAALHSPRGTRAARRREGRQRSRTPAARAGEQ